MNSMVPRKHVPPPAWRWAGFIDETGRVDPTKWVVRGRPTLRQPAESNLAVLQNRDVYAVLISRLFDLPGEHGAFPRAFAQGGEWHALLDGTDDGARAREVRAVFAVQCSALPRCTRQTLWQVHTCGLPVGERNGGDGFCPVVAASGWPAVRETHAQIAMHSPTAELVWRHVFRAWELHFSVTFAPGRERERAALLGLVPQPMGALRDAWQLLRGVTLHAIVAHRHATSLQLQSGGEHDRDPQPYHRLHAASSVYEAVRLAFQAAITGEHGRFKLLERQMRRAGLPASSCFGPHGPMATFTHTWIATRVAVAEGDDSPLKARQLLMPDLPPCVMDAARALMRFNPSAKRRMARSPSLAPPLVLPASCLHVYVGERTETASAFSVVAVTGGDGERDLHATHVFDTARLLPPARGGEDARISAVLEGVCAALEWVAQRRRPAVLRMPLDAPPLRAPVMTDPLERAVALVTSLWDPRTSYRAQRERIHTLWAAAETACAGRLWLAGYDCGARYPWGERCAALAGRTLAPPPADRQPETSCPICTEDYPSHLPTSDEQSQAPPGRFGCASGNYSLRHAVCRRCDAALQRRFISCPLCRGDRVVFLRD